MAEHGGKAPPPKKGAEKKSGGGFWGFLGDVLSNVSVDINVGAPGRPAAASRNPTDPHERMEAVHAERKEAYEETIYRKTEGAEGTAPAVRVDRDRKVIARSLDARMGTAPNARVPDSGGTPLARDVRAKMEPQLGADLSHVQIHTGSDSAAAADRLGARAFTTGNDVHFGAGEFSPGTKEGDRLIAHELTHAVQAQKSGVKRKAAAGHGDREQEQEPEHEVSQPGEPAEQEADAVADHVVEGLHAHSDKADHKTGDKKDGAAPTAAAPAPTIAAKLSSSSPKVLRDPKANASTATTSKGTGPGGAKGGDTPASAPKTPQQRVKDAAAAKDAGGVHGAATTPYMREMAVTLLKADRAVLEQLVALDKTVWLDPVLGLIVTQLDAQLAASITTDLASKKSLVSIALARSAVPFLLMVVGKSGGNGWGAAITPADYDRIMAAAPSPISDKDEYQGVWYLYGDGKGRSDAATRATFNHLYTSRILPPGDQTVVSERGDTNAGAQVYGWRDLYQPVTPDAKAMTALLNAIKSIPQGQVNSANIAFVNKSQIQYMKKTPPPPGSWTNWAGANNSTVLTTSYYLSSSNSIVIQASATGSVAMNQVAIGQQSDKNPTAVGGSTDKDAPKMTFFMNHARHEIGHAVGNRKFDGVGETGDDFAKQYGGWQNKDHAAFLSAYWNKAGKTKLDFSAFGGKKDVEIPDASVAAWMVGIIEGGAEPAGNDVTKQPGTIAQKLGAVRGKHADQQLTGYFAAVFANSGNNPAAMKDNGYQFPGFTPTGDVFIYCSRNSPPGFVSYSKSAYSALVSSHGWYSLASYKEMFAEMYTNKYAGGKVAGAVNGKDPQAFFKQLEASKDSSIVPSDVPPQKTPGPGGAGAAENAREETPPNPPAPAGDAKPLGGA